MSSIERKMVQAAEAMGEATPYVVQHVLDWAKWDCDGVRDELRAYISETLAASRAVVSHAQKRMIYLNIFPKSAFTLL